MTPEILRLLTSSAGIALQALLATAIFPVLCLPLALRSRYEPGGWGLWTVALVLAIAAALVCLGLIYFFSAFAGTSGDIGKVRSAAGYMFFDMGAVWFLAAIFWGPFLSLLIRMVSSGYPKKGTMRMVIALAILGGSATLTVIGAMSFSSAWPPANS